MIYVNGIPLSFYGLTQNEVGVYYRNAQGKYLRALIRNFDDLDPKYYRGYTRYTNGSHQTTKARLAQKALDFDIHSDASISFDDISNTIFSTGYKGSYCKTTADQRVHNLVHTDGWADGKLKPNKTVCKIQDRDGAHLHYFTNKGSSTARDYLKEQGYNYYIRQGSNMRVTKKTEGIPAGAIGKIYTPIVTLENDIPILQLEFTDGKRGVKAKYLEFSNKPITSIGKVPDCEAEVLRLKQINAELEKKLENIREIVL